MVEIELDPRGKCCCFTGHRPEKWDRLTEWNIGSLLSTAVCRAMNKGFTTFISGGAKGVDIIAAEEVIDVRENVNGLLKLVMVLPYPTFGSGWKDKWRERFDRVIVQADEVIFTSEKYNHSVYQRRNEWMVDHSSLVLAVYNGEKGGTHNTLRYARRKGVPVWVCEDEHETDEMPASDTITEIILKLEMRDANVKKNLDSR